VRSSCGRIANGSTAHHLAPYVRLTLRSSAFSDPSVALEFRDVSLAAGVLSSQKWMLRPSDVIGSGISSTATAVTSAAAVAAAAAAATANVVVTAIQSEAVAAGISNGITAVGTGVAGAARLKSFVRWRLVNVHACSARKRCYDHPRRCQWTGTRLVFKGDHEGNGDSMM
jgi:hypothetical protein